ncbi:YraN family protein [Corynebacterium sp. TAE3-ERU12]|uniref:YraN family protein n=1 Tax=Corynebacterium sp. TAE3-ERU12 TaxID=2849491 RepID=UPI001C48D4BA|nr:YraN family protein [Corynebacterium sp. TAE3-ERU12]
MPATRQPTTATGKRGEDYAANYLRSIGMEVIAHNVYVGHDEIDLICRHGHHLVFVEVKTRTGSRFGIGAESVTTAKLARMRRAAVAWLQRNDEYFAEVRFDVCDVRITGEHIDLTHYEAVV